MVEVQEGERFMEGEWKIYLIYSKSFCGKKLIQDLRS
jgi:hypothetical protein